jgi:hypothetical protein
MRQYKSEFTAPSSPFKRHEKRFDYQHVHHQHFKRFLNGISTPFESDDAWDNLFRDNEAMKDKSRHQDQGSYANDNITGLGVENRVLVSIFTDGFTFKHHNRIMRSILPHNNNILCYPEVMQSIAVSYFISFTSNDCKET